MTVSNIPSPSPGSYKGVPPAGYNAKVTDCVCPTGYMPVKMKDGRIACEALRCTCAQGAMIKGTALDGRTICLGCLLSLPKEATPACHVSMPMRKPDCSPRCIEVVSGGQQRASRIVQPVNGVCPPSFYYQYNSCMIGEDCPPGKVRSPDQRSCVDPSMMMPMPMPMMMPMMATSNLIGQAIDWVKANPLVIVAAGAGAVVGVMLAK